MHGHVERLIGMSRVWPILLGVVLVGGASLSLACIEVVLGLMPSAWNTTACGAAQHRLVRRHASGNLFKLAQAEAQSRTGRHRQTLIRMARTHPNPGVGWLKALPPLLLGQTGFELVTRKKTGFSRVTGKA